MRASYDRIYNKQNMFVYDYYLVKNNYQGVNAVPISTYSWRKVIFLKFTDP